MAYDVDAANNIYKIGGLTVALVARADVKGENVGYKDSLIQMLSSRRSL